MNIVRLMQGVRWLWIVASLSSVTVFGEPLIPKGLPRAVDLRADGKPSPTRVFPRGDPYPKLSWTFKGAPGKSQQAYQIEAWECRLGANHPEGSNVGMKCNFVLSGFNPDVLDESVVSRDEIKDRRLKRVSPKGSVGEVGFRQHRATGKTHTYIWRIRLHDGENWGLWSECQMFTPNQMPCSPRELNVRTSKAGEGLGQLIPAKPRPQGQTIKVKAGESLAVVVGRMNPGDTCIVEAGDYQGDVRIGKSFLTIKAAEGAEGKVTIQGEVTFGDRMRHPEGLTLDGLLIRGKLSLWGARA